MEDIEQLCERIVIVREGGVIYDGALAEVTRRFARHKLVTLHLDKPLETDAAPGQDVSRLLSSLDSGVAEVVEMTADRLRVKVPHARVADVSAALLRGLPVVDLNI
jgi:ABC-type uncharacterized transport system ATPase subunit